MIEMINRFEIENAWLLFAIVTAFSFLVGLSIRLIFFRALMFFSKRGDRPIVKKLAIRFKKSIFLFIPMLIIQHSLPQFGFSSSTEGFLGIITQTLIIFSFTLIVVRLIYFVQDVLYDQYDVSKADNKRERQVVTQIIFVRKIVVFLVALIALSLLLLQFEGVRKYGATLLTSAGVAGIIIGFAAQKTISNLLAGLQIAFTQPIKIDDAVVVEGEWGWIEEINLTYVVVKIWDMRRLVLPITYFTEKPFQNWTRNSADIMGSVFLYTDYSVPIEDLRTAFDRFLEETPLWDRKAKVLQVVECTEKSMQLRLLMTAKNSPTAWDLRCFIREKMLVFIQENYPNSLPKTRLELNQKD